MTPSANPYFIKEIAYNDAPDFNQIFINNLKKYKIVHLKGLPEGTDYESWYGNLVDAVGEIVNVDEDIKTGNERASERWTDVRYDKNNDFTFRHANVRQPLHTDAAYTNFDQDVNFLFCVQAADIGGATTFIDATDLIAILEQYEPELLQRLLTTDVYWGKGDDQRKKRKILSKDDRGWVLNWNYYRVQPENTEEAKQLCEDFHRFLENRIVAGGLLTPVTLQKGEAAFFQDDRILHGRNAFYGNRNLRKGGFNFIKN